MLNSFWNTMEFADVSELGYVASEQYPSEQQKSSVVERLDWVILKLNSIRESRKYDYNIVVGLKNKIKYDGWSLTPRGIDFLNLITIDLKGE